jgi:hypothetical protein
MVADGDPDIKPGNKVAQGLVYTRLWDCVLILELKDEVSFVEEQVNAEQVNRSHLNPLKQSAYHL